MLTCIARGEHLSRMKTNGLSVKLPDGGDAFALQEGGAVRFIDGDNAADAGEQVRVLQHIPHPGAKGTLHCSAMHGGGSTVAAASGRIL